MRTPVLPINSVLCPQGRVPLQIFEPKYVDMVSECLKQDRGFILAFPLQDNDGGIREKEGIESLMVSGFQPIGSYVCLVDFKEMDHGLLGVTVEARAKVVMSHERVEKNGLCTVDAEWLIEESFIYLPDEYQDLAGMLEILMRHPSVNTLNLKVNSGDARHVGWRLTELLPIPLAQKYTLMTMTDPIQRMKRLHQILLALKLQDHD